jgi:hypothetical protein
LKIARASVVRVRHSRDETTFFESVDNATHGRRRRPLHFGETAQSQWAQLLNSRQC